MLPICVFPVDLNQNFKSSLVPIANRILESENRILLYQGLSLTVNYRCIQCWKIRKLRRERRFSLKFTLRKNPLEINEARYKQVIRSPLFRTSVRVRYSPPFDSFLFVNNGSSFRSVTCSPRRRKTCLKYWPSVSRPDNKGFQQPRDKAGNCCWI